MTEIVFTCTPSLQSVTDQFQKRAPIGRRVEVDEKTYEILLSRSGEVLVFLST